MTDEATTELRPQGDGQRQEFASTHVIVDVYAAEVDGAVIFGHRWKESSSNQKKKGKIEIPEGHSQNTIEFHLKDHSGRDLSFKDPAADAMWVDLAQCPAQAGDGGQIVFGDRQKKKLTVTDRNVGEKCTLHYALRFDGDESDDGPPYEYDPIIDNGGGGQ